MAIYDVNTIDIEGRRKDGNIELFIISDGGFDDSPEQQTMLMDKIENYMGYALSDEFAESTGGITMDKVWIVLDLDEKPTKVLTLLCERIEDWVNSYGINFRVEYKTMFGKKKIL